MQRSHMNTIRDVIRTPSSGRQGIHCPEGWNESHLATTAGGIQLYGGLLIRGSVR